MSKKVSPTLIGLFTLSGLLLGAAALLLFGAGKFFEKTSNIMLYFDKSANGLLVGSEVRFGGIRIGRVTSIKVLIDQQQNRKIIPVVVELSERDLRDVGSTSGSTLDFVSEAGVKKAVTDGLRARMKQQSLLTGQLYIEFDIVPNSPWFEYQPETKPPFPIVPTIGTELDELISGVANGLEKFNKLDLEGIVKDMRGVLETANTQLAALNLEEINENVIDITKDVKAFTGNEKLVKAIDNLDVTLTTVRELTDKANKGMDPLLAELETVMKQSNASLVKIEEASADIARVTNPRAPVLMRLQNTMDEIESATLAIKELANDLKRHPNAIIVGKAPKKP